MVSQDRRMSRRRLLGSGALVGTGTLIGACAPGAAPAGSGPTSKEPVELTLMVRDIPAEVKSWESVFNVFIEQSGGKHRGNFSPAPSGEIEYTEKVSTLMAGGTAPDVFFLLARAKADFVERKLVLDLTNRIKNSKTANPSLYFKPMQDAMQYKGKLWGTAEDYNSTILMLNLTILKEAGIARPRLDWTYDDYREIARRLRKPEKNQFGGDNWMQSAGLQNMATVWSFARHLWVNEQGTKSMVNSPASVQAHQLFQQLAFADRTIPSPVSPVGQGQGGDQGYFAVWASWANKPWQLYFANQGNVPYEWTMHTFPRGPADQKQGAQGHLYSIPAGVKRPDDAWVLAEWIGGLEGWRQFVKIGKGIPLPIADRALWESYYDFLPKDKANELIDFVLNKLYAQYAMNVSYPPYFDDLRKPMADAMRAIFGADQAAVKSTLDDAARLMDAVLDDYRRRSGQ